MLARPLDIPGEGQGDAFLGAARLPVHQLQGVAPLGQDVHTAFNLRQAHHAVVARNGRDGVNHLKRSLPLLVAVQHVVHVDGIGGSIIPSLQVHPVAALRGRQGLACGICPSRQQQRQ